MFPNIHQIQVRPATMTDLEVVVSFNAALAKETEERDLDLSTLRSGVQALLQDSKKGWYAMAEQFCDPGEKEVVGQILVTFEWSDWRNANFWWLQSLYVNPHHRQKGVFRRLLEYVQTQAQRNGEVIAGFRLYVEKQNHEAHQAYEHLGFLETVYRMYEKPLVPMSGSDLASA